MVGTLTTIFVLLSILALVLIGVVVWLFFSGSKSSDGCPNCGGSGRTVVHDRTGAMQMRCPRCYR